MLLKVVCLPNAGKQPSIPLINDDDRVNLIKKFDLINLLARYSFVLNWMSGA